MKTSWGMVVDGDHLRDAEEAVMREVARLNELIGVCDSLDDADTIYAREPWTECSVAITATDPLSGELPEEAKSLGLRYFLEVSVAKEFLADWHQSISREPSVGETCQRLIQYAIHDA